MKSPVRNTIYCTVLLLLILLAWQAIAPKYPRSQLPPTATEIHDYNSSGLISIQADYFYLLTARIDEDEFQTFVADIGFAESELAADWWPNMNGFEWWTPGESSEKVYASTNQMKPKAVAKYEKGTLYYKEWSGY